MSELESSNQPSVSTPSLNWAAVLGDRRFAALLILVLWAIAYLPGLGARDLRLEEGRRATPALEMARSSNYVVPTLYGETYLNKPPLYFWAIVAVSPLTGGINEWATRLPSALSALAGAWLLLGFAPRSLSREIRAVAAIALLACPIMLDKATLGELDAFVSTLTVASLILWWNGYEKTFTGAKSEKPIRQSLSSWIGAGVCMGLAVLGKGPVCLAVFYMFILPFMIYRQRSNLRALLSAGHLVFLILSLAPVSIWVWALVHRGYVTVGSASDHWASQMGVKELPGYGSSTWLLGKLKRYGWFVPETLINVLPWSIWAVVFMRPKIARLMGFAGDQPDAPKHALWGMLTFGTLTIIGIFFLWPSSETRHFMMISTTLVTLAAIFLVENGKHAQFAKSAPLVRSITNLAALAPPFTGLASLIFAFIAYRPGIGVGIMATCLGICATAVTLLWTRRTRDDQISLAFAGAIAIAILFGRGAFAASFLPYKAGTDTTRILHQQINALIPKGRSIYTTRCFSRPGSESYSKHQYNTQFYLPGGATALTDFAKLPRGGLVTVIVAPDEVEPLKSALPGAQVKVLGQLQDERPKGTLPLVVLEVTR